MKRIVVVPRNAQAGFSVVEGLVAALILLIVVLGVLPLVSQSMLNNVQGNDATSQTNAVVDDLERMLSLPFSNPDLTVPVGATSLSATDFYLLNGDTWATSVPSGDRAQFTRVATVQQFSVDDLKTDDTLDTPLDGGTDPGFVHIKLITMQIQTQRLFGRNPYTVVTVQTY